jgi:hypothetical protein
MIHYFVVSAARGGVCWPLRYSPETVPFWDATARGGRYSPETVPFWDATARGGRYSPETVPTGFRHLPAGRRFALHP